MKDMSDRYDICNVIITNYYDQQQKKKLVWDSKKQARFLDTWITRSDAQNYMIFGDPGARLRIP